MKVNYVIAACSHKASGDGVERLRLHLRELCKTDTQDLAQVTIVRALPLHRDGLTEQYYNIDEYLQKLRCPYVILDLPDRGISYGSWTQVCMKYGTEFDYYIVMEDDYYPVLKNFVPILVDLHTRKLPHGGYLNSFTWKSIAAISNGIIDSKSFLEGIAKQSNPLDFLSATGQPLWVSQVLFSEGFFPNKLADYSDEYRVLFNTNCIEHTHDDNLHFTQDLLNPIEFLDGVLSSTREVWPWS